MGIRGLIGILGIILGGGILGIILGGGILGIILGVGGLMGACLMTIGITGLLGGLLIMPIGFGWGVLFGWLVEQGGYGCVDLGEVDACERVVHELGYAVVAQVANAAGVGVVNVFVGVELSGFDFEAHLFVGVAEGGAGGCKAVDLLDREHGVVARVVGNVLVDLDALDDVGGHVQTVDEAVEGGQEGLLELLQVAEVARGQIVHDECHLLWQGLRTRRGSFCVA